MYQDDNFWSQGMPTYEDVVICCCPLHYGRSARVTMAEAFPEGGERWLSQGIINLLSSWEQADHAEARIGIQELIVLVQPLAHWGSRVCEGEVDIAEEQSEVFVDWVGVPCISTWKAKLLCRLVKASAVRCGRQPDCTPMITSRRCSHVRVHCTGWEGKETKVKRIVQLHIPGLCP